GGPSRGRARSRRASARALRGLPPEVPARSQRRRRTDAALSRALIPVLRSADILALRRARPWLVTVLVLAASAARAESERLVLGTHDAALASALSVAVSPRGLSVVELQEPLHGPEDPTARRALLVPGTVAVVWLCDGAAGGRSLCFCGGTEGRVTVK